MMRSLHPENGASRLMPWSILAAIPALILTLAGQAFAFAPDGARPTVDELLPLSPEAIHRALSSEPPAYTPEQSARIEAAMEGLAAAIGGRWTATAWNPVTMTPRLIAGSGVETGRPVRSAPEAEAAAREFIDRTQSLWGIPSSRLEVFRVANLLGKWSVHFTQTLDGRSVLGSRLTVVMTESGRIASFGGDLWPGLHSPTEPLLGEEDALALARERLAMESLASFVALPGESSRLEAFGILPASASEGRLIYRVRVITAEPAGSWLADVDARTGDILQLQDVLRLADISGTADADVQIPSWCFGETLEPLEHLNVDIIGVDTVVTDADGEFLLPFAGSDPESIRVEFRGSYVNVSNDQGDESVLLDEIVPGTPYAIHWNSGNARNDERDVFYHTNGTHDMVKAFDGAWADLDYSLPAVVNIPSACNANWNGNSINFFHETGNCANTGEIGDVIAHEYGHAVTDYLYGPNDPPGDLHEGNSDVHGNYHTDNSITGLGFYLDDCAGGIRDSDNDLVWPDDLTGGGHYDGQIIAGFHWDIHEALELSLGEAAGQQRAGEIWHAARVLGLPQTQPEQVLYTYIADDDDGNLDNGTPNFEAICTGAAHHGFDCPEVFDAVVIHHVAFANAAAGEGDPIEIEATVYSFAGDLDPDSVLVFYREASRGGFASAAMIPSGGENLYEAEIPNFPVETILEYYVFAADVDHNTLTDPRTAPDDLHATRVVSVFDPFEEGPGAWTVGDAGDDATQGIWELVDPDGSSLGGVPLQPDDDATPDPGNKAWITGQFDGGLPWLTDADGVTTLISPVWDLTGKDGGWLGYQRWFQTLSAALGTMDVAVSNDGGATWIQVDHVAGTDPDPEWTDVVLNISGLFPDLGQFRVRVVMNGEPNPSIDEGGIDELWIIALEGTAGAGPLSQTPPARLQLSIADRHPVVDRARIVYGLPEEGPVRLRVLDVGGRVVETLVDGTLPAGMHRILWTSSGASSGVYFLELATSRDVVTRRVVRIR